MRELLRILSQGDLEYLIRVASPQTRDRSRLLRALREDPDFLAGMLRDSRVVTHLLAEPERVVTASPRLYFAVLLIRVRAEIERTGYTVEQEDRHRTAVFDSRDVAGLLHRSDVLAYLVEMLTSFLKIRTQSSLVRVRRETWRRAEYSDMDLGSLIPLGERAGPAEIFALERRIGDVCLFHSAFFPAAPALPRQAAVGAPKPSARLAELGRAYYHRASERREAEELAISDVLGELAHRFEAAVKPLALMANRYVASLGERIFAP